MAQRLAQGTHNPWVAGSNPAGPTRASAGRGQSKPPARFLSHPRLSAQAPRFLLVPPCTSALHRVRVSFDFSFQIGVVLARNSYSAVWQASRGGATPAAGRTTARSHAKGPLRTCPVSLLASSECLRSGTRRIGEPRASAHQAFRRAGPAVEGQGRPGSTQTS